MKYEYKNVTVIMCIIFADNKMQIFWQQRLGIGFDPRTGADIQSNVVSFIIEIAENRQQRAEDAAGVPQRIIDKQYASFLHRQFLFVTW